MIKYIKIFLQVIIAYVLFSILSDYLQDYVLIIILIATIVVFTLYKSKRSENDFYYLVSACDVDKYLNLVNTKLKTKDESKYLLYLSYGNLYNGDLENIENDISRIDTSKLKARENFVFEEIKLKLLYNNKDIAGYEIKLEEISNGEFKNTYSNELLILKAPLHLLKEEYTELVDLMFELIPKQKQSYRVIELEYYLSVAYIALGKDEDAVAVLEFITKRDFKLDYVVKGRALLETLSKD